MSRFIDIPLPPRIKGYPTSASPLTSTNIVATSSGHESRNRNWRHPRHRFHMAEAIREHPDVEALRDHWLVMAGPFHSFPMRDPLDFASRPLPHANVAPAISGLDQALGTGNGLARQFQIVKTYRRVVGAVEAEYTREIGLPDLDSLIVLMNGLPPDTLHPTLPGGPYSYTVTRPGGVIEFTPAPAPLVAITAGFLFDVPVRFESDDAFEGVVKTYRGSGFSDLVLIEDRLC